MPQKAISQLNPVTGERETVLVDMSAEEIAAAWPAPDLGALKAGLTAQAWRTCEERLEAYAVEVAIASTGLSHPFGCDAESRENIMGVVTAINAGVPIPDPRSWTPKGAISAVSVTHVELIAIGAAVLAAKDAHVQAYLTHKAAIAALADVAAAKAYELGSGWPA